MRKLVRKIGNYGKRAATLLLLFSMALTGCDGASGSASSSSAEGEPDLKIGFVVKNKTKDFWRLMEAGAENEAAGKNAEITFLAPGDDNDAQAQIEEVKKLIDEKVDVICIAPSSDEMLLPVLQDAVDAGIHVIAVDTDSSLDEKAAYIGTDNYSAAKAGAERAAEELGENANAVILRGYLGDKTHDERESGITDGLTGQGVRVEKSVESEETTVADDVKTILGEYPSLSLIITTSDELTQGAYEAIQESGKTDVKLYGFDGKADVVELISGDSFLIGTTAQDPYSMGKLAVDNAVSVFNGEEISSTVYSPYEIIDADNAASYLAQATKLLDQIGDTVE